MKILLILNFSFSMFCAGYFYCEFETSRRKFTDMFPVLLSLMQVVSVVFVWYFIVEFVKWIDNKLYIKFWFFWLFSKRYYDMDPLVLANINKLSSKDGVTRYTKWIVSLVNKRNKYE